LFENENQEESLKVMNKNLANLSFKVLSTLAPFILKEKEQFSIAVLIYACDII
jgi:hypothetical protein